MSNLKYLFQPVIDLMHVDITLYGFTFSFWDVFILSILVGFVGYALSKLFGG